MAGSAVLVPLYVYPFEGAWQPLYDAIAAHPQTQFLVVVNPYNGPGPDALPDANYCREVPKLRSHSNVAVFGYVHVQWAQRQLDTVLQDVETYAAWPNQQNHPHQPLRVDGIFVDETPFAADARILDFLGRLTSMVHQNWPSHDTSGDTPTAWNPARTPTVIHNPGCMPTPEVLALSDLCVVFEDTWTVFLQRVRDGVFADEPLPLPLPLPLPAEAPSLSRLHATEVTTAADATATSSHYHHHHHASAGVAGGADAGGAPAEVAVQDNGNAHAAVVAVETAGGNSAVTSSPSSSAMTMRARRAVVVHSVPLPERDRHRENDDDEDADDAAVAPAEVSGDENTEVLQRRRGALVKEVIVAARAVAGTVFVTELCEGYYERFGRGWREWAGVIGAEEEEGE